MISHSVKPADSRAPKPKAGALSSTASRGMPESKPNSASKPNSPPGSPLSTVTAEMRRAMIAEAAYYIAERRGFGLGDEVEDWLHAEKQIDARLSA